MIRISISYKAIQFDLKKGAVPNEVALVGQTQIAMQYMIAKIPPEIRRTFGYQSSELMKYCEFDENRCGSS